MIRVVEHRSWEEMLARVMPFLQQREVENGLPMRLVMSRAKAGEVQSGSLMFCAERDGEVVGALLRTPGRPVVLSEMDADVASEFARALGDRAGDVTGVIGPTDLAVVFAETWGSGHRVQVRKHMALRQFKLDRVEAVPMAPGELSQATREDVEWLAEWVGVFEREVGEPSGDPRALTERLTGEGRLWVWRDGGRPVSIAAAAGGTPGAECLNHVYTPRELRGRGYATSCVAGLSRHLLSSGMRYCYLFTDLANPTSNSIYQKIGYRPVRDWDNLKFEARAAGGTGR